MYQPLIQSVVSWEAKGYLNLALDSNWFIGIGETDPTFMLASGVMDVDNYMGFLHVEDATTVSLVQSGTAAANEIIVTPLIPLWTPADASLTKRRLGIRIEDNDKLYWYVDGAMVGYIQIGDDDSVGTTSVAFDDAMCSTLCLTNNNDAGGGGAATMTIDYIFGQVSRYG
jgi:hypothetical protein